jgi:hypothetical protein
MLFETCLQRGAFVGGSWRLLKAEWLRVSFPQNIALLECRTDFPWLVSNQALLALLTIVVVEFESLIKVQRHRLHLDRRSAELQRTPAQVCARSLVCQADIFLACFDIRACANPWLCLLCTQIFRFEQGLGCNARDWCNFVEKL